MEDIDWEALLRYLHGDGTPEEREQTRRWLASHPDHEAILAGTREAHVRIDRPMSPERSEAMLASLRAQIGQVPARATPARRPGLSLAQRSRPWWQSTFARAAAVVLVLGAGAWAAQRLRPTASAPFVSAPAPERVFSTARGQRLNLRLTDGSQVTLAPGSTLRLGRDFGANHRRVRLAGGAAFVVTHDSTRPFEVHTRRAVARDLGTRFVVQEFEEDAATAVAVSEGVVDVSAADSLPSRVRGDSTRQRVTAGRVTLVTASGVVAAPAPARLDQYFGWLDGRLVFRDTPLHVVVARLARWYDVDVQLGTPRLRSFPVSASFEEQPLSDVLEQLALALGLTVERSQQTYILRQP